MQDIRASLVQQHEEFGPRQGEAELSAVQLFIKHNSKRQARVKPERQCNKQKVSSGSSQKA